MVPNLTVVDHALLAHRLTELRDAATPSPRFRRLLAEIGVIPTVEATRGLPTTVAAVTTPLVTMRHRKLESPELVAVLRAGLGLLEGGMQVLPEAPVGHVGLVSDEHTLQPSQYMLRMPPEVKTRGTILYAPMLATPALHPGRRRNFHHLRGRYRATFQPPQNALHGRRAADSVSIGSNFGPH